MRQVSWVGLAVSNDAENSAGSLYVVATPIGNLEDLTPRARRTLAEVDVIVAEDTRHTGRLLAHFGIEARLLSLHEHNERERVPALLARLSAGEDIALVSDAGTPLISDPGYALVRGVREAGLPLSPVPGPCAAIAALSIAGLPTDRFVFEGFLPAKRGARAARLKALAEEPRTLVIYLPAHAAEKLLGELADVFGGERPGALGRELTKRFETCYHGTLAALATRLAEDADARRGELVLVVGGAPEVVADDAEQRRLLTALLTELPPRKAASVAASLTGATRNELYALAVQLQKA